MEAIHEAELRFSLASLKGETFHVSGKGQSKISSKRWKTIIKPSTKRFRTPLKEITKSNI